MILLVWGEIDPFIEPSRVSVPDLRNMNHEIEFSDGFQSRRGQRASMGPHDHVNVGFGVSTWGWQTLSVGGCHRKITDEPERTLFKKKFMAHMDNHLSTVEFRSNGSH